MSVDGVHGFGARAESVRDLGCDAFVSGCHKWLYGPRGTGVLWASARAREHLGAIIPSFDDGASYGAWLSGGTPGGDPDGARLTPGGFHSFEHRWALADAFAWHEELGPARVAAHTHGLAGALKDGLAEINGVNVITPRGDELSAGIVCAEIGGDARGIVEALEAEHRVIASVTPYATEYVRFGPSIANTEEDIAQALEAMRGLV